jgi:hypothetical protein
VTPKKSKKADTIRAGDVVTDRNESNLFYVRCRVKRQDGERCLNVMYFLGNHWRSETALEACFFLIARGTGRATFRKNNPPEVF